MDRLELAGKIRQRIKLCRNLAESTTDAQTATALRQIADEGQRDLDRLLSEGDTPGA